MAQIPKNNLKERMQKLGYRPDLFVIIPPTLDNSKVVTRQEPKVLSKLQQQVQDFDDFKPEALNIEDWSDFEEE